MILAKHFSAILSRLLLCMSLCMPPVFAQDPQSVAKVGQDVTVIIERRQVRFTARSTVEEMRLQVFNQSGETVFDSGPVTAAEINWPLQNTNGESLMSGLYAYTLSVKEFGASSARVRRGHFIVDRAKERDGNADKLWVTSQNDNGVGAELTLARDENSTVAGTLLNGERTIERRAETSDREANDREVATETKPKTAVNNLAPSAIGQIAKFIGANNELGDSVITESGGNIGIGITPTAPFHLGLGSGREIAFGTPNGEVGISLRVASGARTDLRYNGSLLQLVNGLSGPPPATNGIAIDTAGKVGIGTTSLSSSRMTVEGQNALTLRGPEPFLTLQDSSVVGGNEHRIQSVRGNLGFFQEVVTELGSLSFVPRLFLQDNGNVGIGTTAPRHQLSLGLGPLWTSNRWGGAMELENGSAIGWKANAAGNRFGIGHTNGGLFFFRTQSDPAAINAPAIGDLSINDAGYVGIGTVNAATKLHVEGTGIVEATIKSNNQRAILVLDSNPPGLAGRYVWTLESGVSGIGGVFGIYDRNANKERLLISPTGLVSVNALEIRGGSDFSENFDISDTRTNGEATQLKPGLLVSINPAQPGKLLLSARAYDHRVAGIISGAGDIKPGLVISQEGSVADGRHPVALSGRVYAWVDATHGAIKPGDLLTTSPTPGHAMKVTNSARAQGAIIGKAMTGLKSGRGLVLVLVTLQ